MYFFGFSQKPFDAEPDLDSLFLVKSQTEALISMIQGINDRRGLILLSGETGTGKTTLLRYLQTRLPKRNKIVFISRISVFFKEILKQIIQDLGLPLRDETPAFFLPQLRAYLAEGLGRNENVVVFVDDAQNLSKENFEDLLLLSQIQEGGVRLLQIVLAGRPELETILESERLLPLKRQIQLRLQIQPLLPEESHLFIEQRLQRAGRSSGEVFTPEALELIVSQGHGRFRNIIFLCEKALRKGLDLKQKVIDAALIWKIFAETDVPNGEEPVTSQELTNRDALIRRLFQNPPRIVKPSIFAEVLSFLKLHPSYLYALGTFVLGLIFYLGWEFLLTSSPSRGPKIEAPSPVAKEQTPLSAPQEKIVISAQGAPIPPPAKKAETAASSPEKITTSPVSAKPKPEAKSEGKAVAQRGPKQPAKAESKKEAKTEGKPEVQKEIRFNEPVEVPKGRTLYSFARDYYQFANPTLVDYILESNPHITDLDRSPTDQKVAIPEILEGSLLAQSPDGSWKIRLGTFESRQAEKAFKEEALLKEKEIEVVPRRVSSATTWYRLYAGKFDTMEEAFKITQELRKKGLLPAFKK